MPKRNIIGPFSNMISIGYVTNLKYKYLNMSNKILYIGSGKSALKVHNMDLSDYTIVCVNNAWRLFEKTSFDIWIHSGDFPRENYPTIKNFQMEVCNKDYEASSRKALEIFKWKTNSSQHYLGYTIFFSGLYWIMMTQSPEKIALLGFDHDYNPEKVIKWNEHNRPNIQNKFNNKKEKNILEWSNNFFSNMEPDFFYGHGTPDPIRLGENHLIEKFELAKKSAKTLGIKLVNFSNVVSKINTIEKEII